MTHPEAVFEKMGILTECKGETFVSKGPRLISTGWTHVFVDEKEEHSEDSGLMNESSAPFPDLHEGDERSCFCCELLEGNTEPPHKYTDDMLLTFMEACGRQLNDEALKEVMKGFCIAISATETGAVPKLLDAGYIEMKGKKTLKLIVLGHFVAERSGFNFSDSNCSNGAPTWAN